MNLPIRFGISLLLLLVIAVCLLVALFPSALEAPLAAALLLVQRRYDPVTQIGAAIGALLIAVLALMLLGATWRRPRKGAVVLAKSPGGTAELAIESIAMRLKRAAEAVPGIREASPVVRGRGNGIDVLMRLSTDSEIDLPETSKRVMETVRSEAETRMGIPVKALKVTFRHTGSGSRTIIPFTNDKSSAPPNA